MKNKNTIPLWVGNVILTKKGQIVLGFNKRGFWQIIGGSQENNEKFSITGQRETFEEANLKLELNELKKLWAGNYKNLFPSIRKMEEYLNSSKIIIVQPDERNFHVFHSIVEEFTEREIVGDDDIILAKPFNLMYVLNEMTGKPCVNNTSSLILKHTRTQLINLSDALNEKIAA